MAKRSLYTAIETLYLIFYAMISVSVSGQTRVVGGKQATPNSAPFIVSLQKSDNGKSTHFCGGTILNANWIVTAAHCLSFKSLVNSTVVVAGSIEVDGKSSSVQKRSVDYYVVHDLFVGGIAPYDIGLIYTKTAFKWTIAVQAAVLPKAETIPSGTASLYGWGSISTTSVDKFPSLLQVVNLLPIITISQCEKELGSYAINLHETNMCTGDLKQGLSVCKSDSGGPLMQGNILVGIVSWGKMPCGQKDSPSVYVRVSSFISWIKEHQILF